MVLKTYSVCLQEKTVESAKAIFKKRKLGAKLSPLINLLLEEWCKREEIKWE